jgi:hypothetical protein
MCGPSAAIRAVFFDVRLNAASSQPAITHCELKAVKELAGGHA